jgi:hypothetical protein
MSPAATAPAKADTCVELAKQIGKNDTTSHGQVRNSTHELHRLCQLDRASSGHSESYKAGGQAFFGAFSGDGKVDKAEYANRMNFLCKEDAYTIDVQNFYSRSASIFSSEAASVLKACLDASAHKLFYDVTTSDDDVVVLVLRNGTATEVTIDQPQILPYADEFSCKLDEQITNGLLKPNVNYTVSCSRRKYDAAEIFRGRKILGKKSIINITTGLSTVSLVEPEISAEIPFSIRLHITGNLKYEDRDEEHIDRFTKGYNFDVDGSKKISDWRIKITQVTNSKECAEATITPGALNFPAGTTMDGTPEWRSVFQAGGQMPTDRKIQFFVDPQHCTISEPNNLPALN